MKKALLIFAITIIPSLGHSLDYSRVAGLLVKDIEEKIHSKNPKLTPDLSRKILLQIDDYRYVKDNVDILRRGGRLSSVELEISNDRCERLMKQMTETTWLLKRNKFSKKILREVGKELGYQMGSADSDFNLRSRMGLYQILVEDLLFVGLNDLAYMKMELRKEEQAHLAF